MPTRIGKFDDQIDSGIHPGLPNDKVPLWQDGRSILFREKSAQPFPGQFLLLQKSEIEAVTGAVEAEYDAEPTLFWGSRISLWKFGDNDVPRVAEDVSAGGGYTGIDDATSTQIATRWSFATYGKFVLAVNGVDVPQIYKPLVGDFAEWRQTVGGDAALRFTTAELVQTLGPFCIVFNLTSGDDSLVQSSIAWGDIDAIEDFVPTADNAAGDLNVRKLQGPIISAEPLGRGHAFYGNDGMYILEYLGPPFYFGQNFLLEGIGAVGKSSIVPVGKVHYGFGPRGVFVTDGVSFDYIDDPSMHDYIYPTFNRDQRSKVVGWHDTTLNIVCWSFPRGIGQLTNNAIICYDYRNRHWTIIDDGRTAATSGSVFDFIVTMTAEGDVIQQSVESFVPAPIAAPLSMENPEATHGLGYGRGGYGDMGYGGGETMDG